MSLLRFLKQFTWLNVQRFRNAGNDFDSWVSIAAFNAAHISRV